MLAAAVHDYAHPGLSNPFLIATRSETAVLYNDQSVLEMFHTAGAFRVMFSTPGCDITEGMSRDQFRQFRETIVSMVLATDLKVHFEHLGRLKTRIATDAFVSVERKDVLFLLGQALHAADTSVLPPDGRPRHRHARACCTTRARTRTSRADSPPGRSRVSNKRSSSFTFLKIGISYLLSRALYI